MIITDYLGITASSKIKLGASINSYTVLKSVAEEVRALNQEFNSVGITAAQTNKSGYNNSDIDVTSTAESMGILHTLDLYLAITIDEGMEEDGELMFTQLKNRYGSLAFKRFRMKMDRSRMRVTDHPDTVTKIDEYKNRRELNQEFKSIGIPAKTESYEEIDIETGEILVKTRNVKSFEGLDFSSD